MESADTALALAADGLGDSYAPQILRLSLDPAAHEHELDPPLADTFALVVRADSRLVSRPVQDFVDRVTAHLLTQIRAQ